MGQKTGVQPLLKHIRIDGIENGRRVDSRVLEERIQQAVADGYRFLEVHAFGQHGIGGRLWRAGDEHVLVQVYGPVGQRLGCMGFPNTTIEVMGPVSDDVGWLNAGAEIIVHGNAANGAGNAMAQGKIYIAGNIGARGMTMTKHNPRFDPPELWVLGSVGDYFAEFMAGGIAVICGYEAQNPDNVIGYRPCVGMVGGRIYFRGPHKGYSEPDVKLVPIGDEDWQWLEKNLRVFLEKIDRLELFPELSKREQWQLLVARSPMEKTTRKRRSMREFRVQVWNKELGPGGLVGDLIEFDTSPIPVITTGILRRYVPVWENRKYAPPCYDACPTGIPVHQRWQLIREGRIDEAVDLALTYTPFPAAVCGYLCPNLCMQACTRQSRGLPPVDVSLLGKASIKADVKDIPPVTGKKIAVVGGGPAGLSVAWQLRMKGHDVTVYDMKKELGGKITEVIPRNRIPDEVIRAELERARRVLPHVHLQQKLTRDDLERMRSDYDFIVIATGAQKPRILPVPGKERLIPALEFLRKSKVGEATVGKRVVIIGAGNVGCDAATEAHRLGAEEITLLDIQEPASFGKERREAEAVGAKFRWPVFTKAIREDGVELTTGEVIPADTVIVSIGDQPDLDFLPESVETERGFVKVNEFYQTSDPQIFAVGDVVRIGLITEAIGAGRVAAEAIDAISKGEDPVKARHRVKPALPVVDKHRVKVEYFEARRIPFGSVDECAQECASCGQCRDCGICITVCPQGAISRREKENGDFEMVVDEEKCIGCGFCAGACPCGVWNLVENEPYEVLASRK
ncbi:FAD-dependent oxidoreductase [Thermodesulforhabdus norvegica]|uniref:Glutamate synthase (NADPH) GltB3 subunit n=1 Tax=Thermodesulforhabdus norvegica TaxID=39841 RepID=A0A1I4VJY5_9BACT|nr:FAD-dependent oxidoreductase [Thermodesulforhabdus norvegica]SFN01564.1 glutamate synthase (NADPH) GltB3 subunit [Thermodesulforhabdus norvegica]